MKGRSLITVGTFFFLLTPFAFGDSNHSHQTEIDLDFGHWYGSIFGAPMGINTPAVAVGYAPASWLEVRARYTTSLVAFDLPSSGRSHVGFVTFGPLLSRELRANRESVRIGVGPLVGCVHTSDGAGVLYGVGLAVRLLIDASSAISLGPNLGVTAVQYRLPGSIESMGSWHGGNFLANHSDAQIDLGLALRFW